MAFVDSKNRAQLPFYPGNTAITMPIPPGLSILQGKVILTGTVVIAGGTTNGTPVGEGGPINLIKRIRIVANPAAGSPYAGGWIVDASARALLRNAQMQHGGKFIAEQNASVLGNGAAATYPIYLEIPIYFEDPNLRNQIGTSLNADASAYQSIQVQIATGSGTDCFSGNDRTWTYNLQLQWWDARVDINRPSPDVSLIQEDHVVQIGAANSRLTDQGLPQDGLFLSWLILAEETAAFTLSDALLNKLTINGPTCAYELFAQDIRAMMYDNEWLDPSENAAGLYLLDMTEGVIQNSNPAAGLLEQYNVNNPSGSFLDQLRIFTRRVYQVQTGS